MKKSIAIRTVIIPILALIFVFCGTVSAEANVCTQSEINTIAISHIQNSIHDLEEAIATKADAETVNTKISELEAAILSAESVAKAYADTGDEAMNNELTDAITSAKAELLNAIAKKADADAVNAKVAELEAAESALTSSLDRINQRTDELEKENEKLRVLVIISCAVSGVLFCGFGTFAIWFIIDGRKRRTNTTLTHF